MTDQINGAKSLIAALGPYLWPIIQVVSILAVIYANWTVMGTTITKLEATAASNIIRITKLESDVRLLEYRVQQEERRAGLRPTTLPASDDR